MLLQGVSMSPNSADKLIVVPTMSPLARGTPPTMDEMIAMERRKVAYGKRFSLAPVTTSDRFNLDAALSNGKLLQYLCQHDDTRGAQKNFCVRAATWLKLRLLTLFCKMK